MGSSKSTAPICTGTMRPNLGAPIFWKSMQPMHILTHLKSSSVWLILSEQNQWTTQDVDHLQLENVRFQDSREQCWRSEFVSIRIEQFSTHNGPGLIYAQHSQRLHRRFTRQSWRRRPCCGNAVLELRSRSLGRWHNTLIYDDLCCHSKVIWSPSRISNHDSNVKPSTLSNSVKG